MGTLANAAILIRDQTFMDWCMAAAAYQARQVILENPATPNHALRQDLALSVLLDPFQFRTRIGIMVGTDPSVASSGSTPAAVTEAVVITKVGDMWDKLSTLGIT